MAKIITKSGRFVLIDPEEDIKLSLKLELNDLVPWSQNNKFKKKSINLYQRFKNKVIIPRAYGINKFGVPKRILLRNGINMIDFINTVKYNLYDYQISAVNKILEYYRSNFGGILIAPTGSGKTIISIEIALKINKKTLIVVETKTLARQWVKEIKKTTLQKAVIISNLSRNNQNLIMDKINSHNFIISVINSLTENSKKFSWKTFRSIGFVIIDEVHMVVSSRKRLSVFNIISRRFILGITATPKRADGLEKLMKFFIGKKILTLKNTYKGKCPKVHMYYYINNEYQKILLRSTGQIDYMKTLLYITEDPIRRKKIIDLILKYNNSITGRILVISKLRSTLEFLYSEIVKKEKSVGIYYSVQRKKELMDQKRTIENSKIILSIFNLSKQSLDIRDCTCIILLSSVITHKTKNKKINTVLLDQICGRCLRKNHKKSPKIVIFNDYYSFFIRHALSRTKYFTKKSWKIKHFDI